MLEGWGSRRGEGDVWNMGPVFESVAGHVAQHRAKTQAVDPFGQEQVEQKHPKKLNLTSIDCRSVEDEGEQGTSREASTSLAVDVDGSKFAAS